MDKRELRKIMTSLAIVLSNFRSNEHFEDSIYDFYIDHKKDFLKYSVEEIVNEIVGVNIYTVNIYPELFDLDYDRFYDYISDDENNTIPKIIKYIKKNRGECIR